MAIEVSLEELVVGIAEELGTDVSMTVYETDGTTKFVRSKEVSATTTTNVRVAQLVEANKVEPSANWCEDCEHGNYAACEYANAYQGVGAGLTCPEYTLSCRDAAAKAESEKNKDKSKSEGNRDAGKPWRLSGSKPKGSHGSTKLVTPIKGVQSPPKPSTGPGFKMPAAAAAPKIPFGIFFRCSSCWHWFENEDKLAKHITWACPGRDSNTPETQVFAIKCSCCIELDRMIVSKKPLEPSKEIAVQEISETATVAVTDDDNEVPIPGHKEVQPN